MSSAGAVALTETVADARGERVPSEATTNLLRRIFAAIPEVRQRAARIGTRTTMYVGDGFSVSSGNGEAVTVSHNGLVVFYPAAIDDSGPRFRAVGILVEADESATRLMEHAADDCLPDYIPSATYEWDVGDDEAKEAYRCRHGEDAEAEIDVRGESACIFEDYYDPETGESPLHCRLIVPAPWRAAILALFEARASGRYWAIADPSDNVPEDVTIAPSQFRLPDFSSMKEVVA